MAIQIQWRRDTAANWTAANPTLAQGEAGLEIDTGKIKLGDGATAWNSLAYFTGGLGMLNALSAGTQSASSGTVVFSNSNGMSFGMSGSSRITASYTVPSTAGLISAINVSAGTTSNNLSALTFSDGGNVSFGLNGSVITASAPAGGGGAIGLSAGTQSVSTGTVVFSNSNGITFGMSGSSRITASHDGLTTQSGQAFSADVSSTFQTLTFQNSNGVSFSNNAGALRITHDLAGTTTAVTGRAVLTLNSAGLRFDGSGIAGTGYTSTTTAGTAIVATNSTNGLSLAFPTIITNALTTARASTDAVGLNTAQTNVTWTVNSSGISLNAAGYAGTTTAITGGALLTLNSLGLRLDGSGLAGTSTGFAGANISGSMTHNSAGLNLSLSVAAPGAAAENNWMHLLGANTAGNTTASGSTIGFSGINLILSGTNDSQIIISAAANGTLSRFLHPDIDGIALNTSGAANNSVSFKYFILPDDLVISQARHLFSVSANTHTSASTNTYGVTLEGAIYTRNASTITLASSASATWSGTYSTNSTASVAGVRELTLPLSATMSPGEYWYGLRLSTSSVNASVGWSIYQGSGQGTAHLAPGRLGAATATSQVLHAFHGIYSATSGALPSSATLNQVLGTGTQGSHANIFMELRNWSVV